MFIFMEGNTNQFPKLHLGIEYFIDDIYVNGTLTFEQAIKCLSDWRTRNKMHIVIFKNFFQSIRGLSYWQKRGIERIALGDNGLEIPCGRERSTRFLNVMYPSETKNIDFAIKFINQRSSEYPNGIGFFQKRTTLIVGDTPGKNSQGLNTPFVGSGSGKWLSEQLEKTNIVEEDLYWINSKDNFGVEADINIGEELNPSKVIALGNNALEWIDKVKFRGCSVHKVPHPQYWKRFKNKEPYPLFDVLTTIKLDWLAYYVDHESNKIYPRGQIIL